MRLLADRGRASGRALCSRALVLVLCIGVGAPASAQASAQAARPGARTGHNLVYDRANARTLLLFGYSGDTLPPRPQIWAWRAGVWSVVDRAGPGFRSLSGVAIDDASGALMMFGGAGPNYATRYGDSWTWSRGEWTQRVGAGPGPTDHHTVAYDQRRRTLVSFGGNTPTGDWHASTWAMDSTGWRIIADSLSGPPPRAHHAMVYDSRRERIVVFGGLAKDRSYLGDTWEWDGARWHRVDVAGPTARTRHRMAYDARRGVIVLYGGTVRPAGQTTGLELLGDLWEYDGRAWRRIDAPSGPGDRMVHAMTFDESIGETLLFGGSDGVANRDDLWSWNGARWLKR
jgi:hypothetical protein